MGKIIKKRIEYGGSSNSAENIKYDDTKNVKEAINEVDNLLGNTDISAIGDGTVTGGLNALNSNLKNNMQTIDSLKNMNINPLIKELKPNSLYMAFTYGNSGNIIYSKVWIIHTSSDKCFIQYIAEPTTDDTTSITADGLTVTISSNTTLVMGIYKIS